MLDMGSAWHWARELQVRAIGEGARVIDATMGGGGDTQALCEMVGESGRVYAFDIQQSAVDRTRARLEEAGLLPRAELFCASHARMAEFVHEPVDAVVFHEVRTQPDKLALVKEALRVVKPGGYFAFEDVFYSKRVYGDMDKFVEALKPYVDEIHFEDMRKPDYAPKFLNTPLILGQMGMIWGRKSAASNKG